MNAMFALGPIEILILGVLCLATVAVPVVIIIIFLSVNRKNRGDG